MKTISMDYKIYKEELALEGKAQFHLGISEVMKWLESGKALYEYLGEAVAPTSHWGRIAKAIGREREVSYDCSIRNPKIVGK